MGRAETLATSRDRGTLVLRSIEIMGEWGAADTTSRR